MLPAQRPATQDYSSRIRLVFGRIQGPRRVIERRTVLIHTLIQFYEPAVEGRLPSPNTVLVYDMAQCEVLKRFSLSASIVE